MSAIRLIIKELLHRKFSFLLSLLAFHLAGLFLFEEHLNNPTFVVLASWLVAAVTWRPAVGAPRTD